MSQTMSGHYSYGYPLEETNGNARPPANRSDTLGSNEGDSKGVRRTTSSDLYNIMSDSEETKQRRASVKATNANATRKRSRNTLRDKTRAEKPEEHVDDSAWIHRDKLAEIEIQEMENAGIPVARQSRRSSSRGAEASARSSRSQSRSRRPMSRDRTSDQYAEEQYNAVYGGQDDFERKRISTIPAVDEDEQAYNPDTDFELRTPEEVAAERGSIRSNVIRPSTSRIPVSKISPVPVPQNVVGRDSPLPRSRHGSGAWSGNWDEMQYARRARSNSIGSAVILDEDGVRTPPLRPSSSHMNTSDESSPSKARVPNKFTPVSGGRKGSMQNGVQRPGSSSGNKSRVTSSAKDRPASRSGRPSTSHQQAPEGQPPWIAGMYKPDPRLPPDQQMLPTHAKRMMQEQWEREGKTGGTVYDRDLRPLNDESFPVQPPKSPTKFTETNEHQAQPQMLSPTMVPTGSLSPMQHELDASAPNSPNMNQWPLTPKSETKSDNPPSRPGTSGGYRITPTITTPPAIQRSPVSQAGAMAQPHNPTPRVPDFDEKEEAQPKKGGCGCCIVM